MIDSKIINDLFLISDENYKNFHSKLIPNVEADKIIGVRTPELRKYAKDLYKKGGYEDFLTNLPHYYYDENNLHSFIISQITDFDICIKYVDNFLPYVDNWAVSDMMKPKCFSKNKSKLYHYVCNWLKSDKTYTVRYAIVTFMNHYIDDEQFDEILKKITAVKSQEYYVNMAIAWFLSTALVKQYDKTIILLKKDCFRLGYTTRQFRKHLKVTELI